jgi:hypothetical protein
LLGLYLLLGLLFQDDLVLEGLELGMFFSVLLLGLFGFSFETGDEIGSLLVRLDNV